MKNKQVGYKVEEQQESGEWELQWVFGTTAEACAWRGARENMRKMMRLPSLPLRILPVYTTAAAAPETQTRYIGQAKSSNGSWQRMPHAYKTLAMAKEWRKLALALGVRKGSLRIIRVEFTLVGDE